MEPGSPEPPPFIMDEVIIEPQVQNPSDHEKKEEGLCHICYVGENITDICIRCGDFVHEWCKKKWYLLSKIIKAY